MVVGFRAGGGDQRIHMGDELLFTHIGFCWGLFGRCGGEQVSAVDLAGLDLRQNILRAVSRPQALCRPGHLAGVEAATLQAQGGYPCGQFRAKGFLVWRRPSYKTSSQLSMEASRLSAAWK